MVRQQRGHAVVVPSGDGEALGRVGRQGDEGRVDGSEDGDIGRVGEYDGQVGYEVQGGSEGGEVGLEVEDGEEVQVLRGCETQHLGEDENECG